MLGIEVQRDLSHPRSRRPFISYDYVNNIDEQNSLHFQCSENDSHNVTTNKRKRESQDDIIHAKKQKTILRREDLMEIQVDQTFGHHM